MPETSSTPLAELQQSAVELRVAGCKYLLQSQARDGGWHSRNYGQLKDGAAMTALVLYTLASVEIDKREPFLDSIARGFEFLAVGLEKKNAPAAPDGTLDFPTYAAAHWLLAVELLGEKYRDKRATATLAKFLVDAQLAEARGFDSDHPQYGGWDFLSRDDAQGITTGTSISVTTLVIRALATLPETREQTESINRGVAYVKRCRASEGFTFTCEPMSLSNKAGYRDEAQQSPRPYGTATCDGILALRAAKVPSEWKNDRAILWLQKQANLEIVPGFEALPQEVDWQRGLKFYYYQSLAPLLEYFPANERLAFAKAMLAQLKQEQQRNGSWANASARMREDDPLIATSFAVSALTDLSRHLA